MTPTMILGASLICTIAGLIMAIFYRGKSDGRDFGEMTGSLKSLAESVREIKDLFKAHGARLDEHEGRISKLEFCLDIDGQATSVVGDVMKVRERLAARKRRNEA